MSNPKTPKGRYQTAKDNAKFRGIEFNLTFEQWFKVWADSGHFNQIGKYKGQYVMARRGDEGPYAIGNVFIASVEENHQHQGHRAYGTRTGRAKLTEKLVFRMRRERQKYPGERGAKYLAQKYGVAWQTVYNIVSAKKTWVSS